MFVITSGDIYIDIDAYASMIVYREYLKRKGIECVAITNSTLNDSISKSIIDMDYKLDDYIPSASDQFIILDVSEYTMLDKSVDLKNVVEVIDHHFGYEEYWKDLLGDKSQIESVGSVATLIYERIISDGMDNIITVDLAKMLVAAILDNTLNLKAKITSERDINAFNKLMILVNDDEYPNNYYAEIEDKIKENVVGAIKNETNLYSISRIIPKYFSQLVVFDKKIVLDNLGEIYSSLNMLNGRYVINLICLSEGKSYIITPWSDVKKDMEFLFESSFDEDIMKLNDIWLRKEIIKRAKELIIENDNKKMMKK